LNNSKKFVQICERLLQEEKSSKQFREISLLHQRLQQRIVSFKELMKFFQIFERLMNFSSTEENPCKGSKEHVKGDKNEKSQLYDQSYEEIRGKNLVQK
jgi:hypothetical protein